MGDVAMTLPSVYNACAANPNDNFYFLTRPHPAQVFENKPENLTIVGIDLSYYRGARGIWILAEALRRRYAIDTFVDLHDVLRTQLLRAFLAVRGVKCSHIDKGRSEKKKLTRPNNKVLIQLKSTALRYDETFARAGVALADSFRSLYGADKGNPLEFREVSGPKQPGEKWIAVAPFAKHPGKVYPFESLAKVVEHFAAQENVRIFMFGYGANEQAQIETLSSRHANVVDMATAMLGIGAELALLSHCDVMLSMDSANMHLASLVDLRTISVWGATHPYTGFFGRGQKPTDAVQLDMTCRPCSVFGNKPCVRGDYHCLRGITPQMIIRKVNEALGLRP